MTQDGGKAVSLRHRPLLTPRNTPGTHFCYRLSRPQGQSAYQEHSLRAKGGRCVGWQPYHLHVPTVLNSGSLKLLEPSGFVQACNGIDFFFPVEKHNGGLLWSTSHGPMTVMEAVKFGGRPVRMTTSQRLSNPGPSQPVNYSRHVPAHSQTLQVLQRPRTLQLIVCSLQSRCLTLLSALFL